MNNTLVIWTQFDLEIPTKFITFEQALNGMRFKGKLPSKIICPSDKVNDKNIRLLGRVVDKGGQVLDSDGLLLYPQRETIKIIK